MSSNVQPTPLEDSLSRAARRTKTRAQGRLNDYEIRRAIELHAEDRAVELFEADGWDVERVGSLHLGFDLLCKRSGLELHVEVKGTQRLGEEVILTRNEVTHHAEYGGTCEAEHCLFVVSQIEVERHAQVTCQGGSTRILRPWIPQHEGLTPSEYMYRLPMA